MDIAVSVVVPAHNSSEGVLRGLDSLRRQTLARERFEVIYVDDGSTDGTGELLDAEAADEPNFSVVHIDNSGWPGRPRNVGFQRARGRYVLFMDDDDRLGPEALSRLYRQASQDRADIVIGRVAGLGRTAPREIFQQPMSGGSLRTHPLLLSSLTVQKLFRRGFLLDNGIAFPEGRVRLEDHMFMLQAYLATDRVSVVHDYTCYYWVRNKGFGNISYTSKEPAEFLGSVERIFDIIDGAVEPGAFRDRLIAHWLRSKVLGLFQGRRFLRQDAERVALMQRHAADLVRRRIPDSALARLNAFARLRAAALAEGDPAALVRLAEFEEDVVHRTRITGFAWDGPVLAVGTDTVLERRSTGRALEFVREGSAVYWDLPAELLEVPPIKEAAQVGRLSSAACRAFASKSDDPAVVRLPLETEPVEEPAEAPGRVRLRLTGTMRVDAAGGDHGHPLDGAWKFSTRVVIGGVAGDYTLGPDCADGAERTRTPAFVGSRGAARFANPYRNADGLLVLSTTGSWRPLRRALRTGLPPAVSRTAAGLRVEVPLAVQAAAPGTLTLTCTREGREPLSAPARVYAPPRRPAESDLPTAVLTATLPMPSTRGVLHIGVGEGDAHTPLGLDLYWTPLGWRVGRPRGPLAQRLKRTCTQRARWAARRAPRPVRLAYTKAKHALRPVGAADRTARTGVPPKGSDAAVGGAVPRQAAGADGSAPDLAARRESGSGADGGGLPVGESARGRERRG